MTLDLSNTTYKPFLKTNQYPSYINVSSNHLKTTIKQVAKAVKLRIRNLSANEKIFQGSSKIYMDALKNSDFREEFTYQEENIPNVLIQKIRSIVKKIEKEKLYGLTPPFF